MTYLKPDVPFPPKEKLPFIWREAYGKITETPFKPYKNIEETKVIGTLKEWFAAGLAHSLGVTRWHINDGGTCSFTLNCEIFSFDTEGSPVWGVYSSHWFEPATGEEIQKLLKEISQEK